MPIIDLGEWPKNTELLVIYRLLALMLFPEDARKRNQYLLAQVTLIKNATYLKPEIPPEEKKTFPDGGKAFQQAIEQEYYKKIQRGNEIAQSYFYDLGGENTLLMSPDYNSVMEEAEESFANGMVTGEALVLMKQMVNAKINDVSKRKAHDLMVALRAKPLKKRYGLAAANRDSFHTAWTKYKTVAHLWATYYLLDINDYPEDWNIDSDKGLIGFLNIAEQFRKFITTFLPYQAKRPMITDEETWRSPERIPLNPISINLPKLSSKQRELLKGYQSKVRPKPLH